MSEKDSLLHYASKYYDPVKAHEYYMRTRELKGRCPASKLSDEGKEIWSYTKSEIKSEKVKKTTDEKATRDQTITELRQQATEARVRITGRLKELNDILKRKAESQRQAIQSKRKSDIETLSEKGQSDRKRVEDKKAAEIKRLQEQEIPKNISKESRARLIEERKAKISKLREDAKSDKQKISADIGTKKETVRTEAKSSMSTVNESVKSERKSNSDNAASERKRVSAELKTAISAAREAYQKAKTSLDSSYEDIYQREYDSILSQYEKTTKKVKRKKKKKSSQ